MCCSQMGTQAGNVEVLKDVAKTAGEIRPSAIVLLEKGLPAQMYRQVGKHVYFPNICVDV